MSSKKLVKLLMHRDGISRNEAENLIDECKEEVQLAIACGHWEKAEDIIKDYLGLEPDYVEDLLEL